MHITQVSGGDFDIDLGLIETVDELIVAVREHMGQGDVKHIVLYCNGNKLLRNKKLSAYGVDNNSSITYMSDLNGGCGESCGCDICGVGCSENCCCSIL